MAAYDRRDIVGGAVATTISGSMTSTSTSFTIAATTGWPAGTNGLFYVVLDRGTASEEKLLCTSRSGSTVNVLLANRGADGTSATAHASGATAEICGSARDDDEANLAVAKTIGQATAVGQVLVVDAPNSFAAVQAKTAGQLLVGNGTTVASVAMSGDGTLAGSGALTLDASIARDAEVTAAVAAASSTAAAALTAHEADTTSIHGIASTAALVLTGDARLSDTRTPTDGTVTLAKMAATVRPITLATAAPGSPTAGDFWFDTDDYAFKEYTTGTTGWTAPWNLPWGVAGTPASKTSVQSGINLVTAITNSTVTFTAVANRRYRVTAKAEVAQTVAGDVWQLTMVQDGVTQLQRATGSNGNTAARSHTMLWTGTFSAGSRTVALYLERATGSGTLSIECASTQPTQVLVEDIGPSANPA